MIDYYSNLKSTERETDYENLIFGAIKINEKEVMEHLDGLVRKSVEEPLNTLFNAFTVTKRERCFFQRVFLIPYSQNRSRGYILQNYHSGFI